MSYTLTLRKNMGRKLSIKETDDNWLYLEQLALSGTSSGGTGATGPQGIQGPTGPAGTGSSLTLIQEENGNAALTFLGTVSHATHSIFVNAAQTDPLIMLWDSGEFLQKNLINNQIIINSNSFTDSNFGTSSLDMAGSYKSENGVTQLNAITSEGDLLSEGFLSMVYDTNTNNQSQLVGITSSITMYQFDGSQLSEVMVGETFSRIKYENLSGTTNQIEINEVGVNVSGDFLSQNNNIDLRIVNSMTYSVDVGGGEYLTVSVVGNLSNVDNTLSLNGIVETSTLLGGDSGYRPIMLSTGTYSTFNVLGDFGYIISSTTQGPGGHSTIRGTTTSVYIEQDTSSVHNSSVYLDGTGVGITYDDFNTSDIHNIQVGTAAVLLTSETNGNQNALSVGENGVIGILGTESMSFGLYISGSSSSFFEVSGNGNISTTINERGGTMGYTDNNDATKNGLSPGEIYHTMGTLKVVL